MMTSISILIPVYNEEESLQALFEELKSSFENNQSIEIIFINDGSSDMSQKVIENEIANHSTWKLINLYRNYGKSVALQSGIDAEKVAVIPCHCAVEDEWLRPVKPWNGRWRKDRIDLLFPADPRRPEKNHLLALQTGELLEERGWIVGMTTLKIQPRSIVWDRMLVADLTLVTSKRESGPLVARESIACGTPVVSVNVGDVATYLPEQCVVASYDAAALADACEAVLKERWNEAFTLPHLFSESAFLEHWNQLLESLVA